MKTEQIFNNNNQEMNKENNIPIEENNENEKEKESDKSKHIIEKKANI